MPRKFDLTEEKSRNPYSGCGEEDSTYILEKDICDEFSIAGIQQESCAFKCEGTESGECSEEAYEKDGHPFLIQRQFCFPEDETESGEKGSDDIDEKSPCGQSGQELADSAHTSIAEKSSCKTCASCQEEYFHNILSVLNCFLWGRQILHFFLPLESSPKRKPRNFLLLKRGEICGPYNGIRNLILSSKRIKILKE